MVSTLLTFMLFILPFLVSQREISRPGLYTGLWISLFFWGRVHALFAILTFGTALVEYVAVCLTRDVESHVGSSHLWVPRSGARPLTALLAIMMVFCAFGNVCRDYGTTLAMTETVQKTALALGFAGSLTGPFLFGALSDKTGPFRAFMTLLFLGLSAVFFTVLSPDFPYFFPLGSLLMQAVIGGVFTLMPQLLIRFYGRPQLVFVLPLLLLFLAALWTAALHFYETADALPEDYLLTMIFLLVAAAPLARHAWRRRLSIL